jgi:hypothetical protein
VVQWADPDAEKPELARKIRDEIPGELPEPIVIDRPRSVEGRHDRGQNLTEHE